MRPASQSGSGTVRRLVFDFGVPVTHSRRRRVGATPQVATACLGNPKTQRRPHRMDPPPHLDSGQSRVNDYHHPENYLLPDDDDQ
jgi:hypothetical protein